ncbi:MAG: hypothetical protein QM692_24180, partial [Thermomicrobiales bacterium]
TLPPPTATPLPTATPEPTPTPLPDAQATHIIELEAELTRVAAIPTATVAPTATPDTCVETVSLNDESIVIHASEWANATVEQRKNILRERFSPFLGRRIGLSLTFGHYSSLQSRGTGVAISNEANELLEATLPELTGGNPILKDYASPEDDDAGGVTFEVYFLTDACA